MIYLYSGTPGSGKSLHQAIDIYYCLKYKKPVVANYQINTNIFHKKVPFIYLPNDKLTPFELVEISKEYFKIQNF